MGLRKSPAREQAMKMGWLFYKTGEPCRNGHLSKRYTSNNNCVECERTRPYDSKKSAAKRAFYRQRFPEKVIAARRAAACDPIKVASKRSYARARGPLLARRRRETALSDPIRLVAVTMSGNLKRRCKDKGLCYARELTGKMFLENWLRSQTNCPICDVLFDVSQYRARNGGIPSLDQLSPGEGYTLRNTRLICLRCNTTKSNATVEQLRRIADWTERELAL